jgi:hypothetical protein
VNGDEEETGAPILGMAMGLPPPSPLAEAELQEGRGGGRTISESRRRPTRTGSLTDHDDNNQEDFYVASMVAGRATLGASMTAGQR